MKIFGNILCTIAILAQVLLSAGLHTHAPDCPAAHAVTTSDDPISTENLNQHFGHDHHHHEAPVHDEHCYSLPSAPDHECCSAQKTYPYILSDPIVDKKSKDQSVDSGIITTAQIDFNQHSLLLSKTNQSNAPPPPLTYLPQHNAHFTSIYLGVFLL